jgi:heterodisulfide reductase subunit A-like polyferredoxin
MVSNPSTNLPIGQSTPAERAPRIGVFVCDCGDQVASILDVETLVRLAGKLPGVVNAERAPYWCSADGRERLRATVCTRGLERVVVAGCSPRTHRRLFQETLAQAELSRNLLGLVNIREGCAWPHQGEHRAATSRARDQIAMEVAHTSSLALRTPVRADITPTALIIGGGVAGMTAALELANAGIPVTLVERATTLGGVAIADAPELAADLITAVRAHPGISLKLENRVTHVDGSVGAYHTTIVDHGSQGAERGPFGAIIVATGTPDEETGELARLLRLTQDAEGFLPELRVRLRPDSYIERGIYVCGSAHYACDVAKAQFQAFSASSRALRHLRRERVTVQGPVAQVAPEKCNGCGDCFRVCPFAAVTMTDRPEGLSLAIVSPFAPSEQSRWLAGPTSNWKPRSKWP